MMVTAQSGDPSIPPFTTNPVPEASSWVTLMAGLGMLALATPPALGFPQKPERFIVNRCIVPPTFPSASSG
jgi:hypothetical protein